MATIKIRRGIKSELDALIAGTPLAAGELGWTTDTKEVYAGDGTNHWLVGGAKIDTLTNRPTAGVGGRLFHASDTDVTYVDDGTSWVLVGDAAGGVSDLDDVADGTTYVRLLAAAAYNNQATKIVDATHTVTTDDAWQHISNSATLHRTINDAGSAATDLWSASKIGEEISLVVSGIDPQDSIVDFANMVTSENPSPSVGMRYINQPTTGSSSETFQSVTDNYIYEWNGSDWTETIPNEGMHLWDEAGNAEYIWNGQAWVLWAATSDHKNLAGLQGGTTDEFYHLTSAQHTAIIGGWSVEDDDTDTDVIIAGETLKILGGASISTNITAANTITIINDAPNVSTTLALGTITGTAIPINSDGTSPDITLPAANTTEAGLLTATLWNKLDGIEASADANVATNIGIGTVTATVVPLTSSTGSGANFPAATATLAGMVTNAAQSFGGVKTFIVNPILPTANPTTAYQATHKTYVDLKVALAGAESITGVKTFDKGSLKVKGTSTGATDLTTANTSATSYTATFPAKDGTVAMIADVSAATGSGLEAITENVKDGYRFVNEDAANHGEIGNLGLDMAFSDGVSSVIGATGTASIAIGHLAAANGNYTISLGYNNSVTDDNSVAIGATHQITDTKAIALGYNNDALAAGAICIGQEHQISGINAAAIGDNLTCSQNDLIALGSYNEDTAGNVFEFGFGSGATPANALEIDTNGVISAPGCTTAEISSKGNAALTTKEYADALVATALFDADFTELTAGVLTKTAATAYATVAIGVADNNFVTVDGTIATGEFTIWTANGLGGTDTIDGGTFNQ